MKKVEKEKDFNPPRLNSLFVCKDTFIILHFLEKRKRCCYG